MAIRKIVWSKFATKVSLHFLFWVLVIAYFSWGFGLNVNPKLALMNAFGYLPGHMIMTYSLLYFLIPRFLLQKKIGHFLIGFVLLVLICALYAALGQLAVNANPKLAGVSITVGRNIMPFIHVGGIAASIKLLKNWYSERKRTLEAEQQRAVAELQLLKAQLHPHFLFNTLNNLYSHTLEFSPKSPEIVLKLSALLRFMIYESDAPRISLAKEMALLENYSDLEQLRYGDRIDISISVTGEIEKYQIAPLLLLPFLENAFKHGTSRQIEQCWISLDLCMAGDTMNFKLLNSLDPSAKQGPNPEGIGLKNVVRRCKLLYNDKYSFEAMPLEDVFCVKLELRLEKLEEKFKETLQPV